MTKTHLTDKKFSDFAIAPEVVAGLTESGFEKSIDFSPDLLGII